MREHPKATTAHLAQLLAISEEGARYHINNLKKGVIIREGGPKTGRWVVQ